MKIENGIKYMEFREIAHHDGENCTVRQGTEWAHNLQIGEEFNICLISHIPKYVGTVTALKVTTFNNIDAFDIKNSRDPNFANVLNLFNFLDSVYPNFKSDDIVTIVYYTVRNT